MGKPEAQYEGQAFYAKYSIELAKLGYQVTLTDLTPSLVNLAQQKANELGVANQFDGFFVMDARSLDGIESDQFDASLMMGPLYHLQSEDHRIAAVKELYRVTKHNGVVFVAFMTRVRKLQTALMYPDRWKPLDNINSISEFMETGIFDHSEAGRFTGGYFYNIKDIRPSTHPLTLSLGVFVIVCILCRQSEPFID